jgi:dTDP-4-amino-4,6-dideoxygalactose transaminase
MNLNVSHLEKLINKKTKAIVTVDFGGCPADYDAIKNLIKSQNNHIYLIEDAAHAIGAIYKNKSVGEIADFTIFSFQAIKHITTGDGGYLSYKNPELTNKAKKLRWFGIDRVNKSQGIWDNDIVDVGYKYQMNDISASMGLSALQEFETTLNLRKSLFMRYYENLIGSEKSNIQIISDTENLIGHAAWLFSVHTNNREKLQQELISKNIESSQVHYRNDRYSIFGKRRKDLKNMDKVEDTYLVLPLHTKMNVSTVDRICSLVSEFG